MKTLFAIAAAVTVTAISLITLDNAEARGPRGAGTVSMGNIQTGPRVTTPVIRPDRIGNQQFPQRQVTGLPGTRNIFCTIVRVPHTINTSSGPRTHYHYVPRCTQRI